VRDFPREFLLAALGVADLKLELLDMEGGKDVFGDKTFVDDDGILKIVPAPRHEGHEDIAPQGQLAVVGGAAVGKNIPAPDTLPGLDDRRLIDARILVCAEELDEPVLHPLLLFEGNE